MARLTIWGGNLEVVDTGDGSIPQIVTEYADEEGSGRTVTQVQFPDNHSPWWAITTLENMPGKASNATSTCGR